MQQLASDNKLSPVDISGGTITLSNIGAIGGKYGSPLLNLPEVSIIAIGRIQKVPQFADDGNVYPASIMTVSIHFLFSHFNLFHLNNENGTFGIYCLDDFFDFFMAFQLNVQKWRIVFL